MRLRRRDFLWSTLLGGGYLGLRALATGLPASFLASPRRALAAMPAASCADSSKAQFVIFCTSGQGDPINASVPGTYDVPGIVHSPDPQMAPTSLSLGGRSYNAAAPWASLPQTVLDRTCFWHLMTNTPVHPKEPEVLQLMGSTSPTEMLPSLLAKQLAPCLGTLQVQPITVGATTPSEALSFEGAAQPIVPPLALKSTLANPAGPLTMLQPLRDQTLAQLYDLYKHGATPAQRAYLDSLVSSQAQVRGIEQDLLTALDSIKDNSANSQVTAALALIRMNVTPVVTIHIPFGGDNHHDLGLKNETAQTLSGVQTIASLMAQLDSLGLADRVTFVSLNVFGRTLGAGSLTGRQHNANHQVSIAIGNQFASGVIGGVGPVGADFGALAIDPASGQGAASGAVAPVESLASFGKTMLASLGADATALSQIRSGTVIPAALA
jgi:hypothetical protein